MKRCPSCHQWFTDTTLKFCRLDGTQLVDERVPLGDAPTILFSTTRIGERFPWLVPDAPSNSSQPNTTGDLSRA